MGSSHGIKVFGVSLAGAQGRELHLPLCLPTEMFLDCIPAWTLMHPSVPHSLSSFQEPVGSSLPSPSLRCLRGAQQMV